LTANIGVELVSAQQRESDSLDTEANTIRVSDIAVRRLDPKRDPEMVEVIVG
jgi:hypothetical protein